MNDTFGYQAGDEVLRQVSKYLSGFIRRSDFVCRCGGEELLLLPPGCDLAQGTLKANDPREGISQLPLSAGGMPQHHHLDRRLPIQPTAAQRPSC